MGAGLGDGVIKVWELKNTEIAKSFRSSVGYTAAITHIGFNNNNSLLAASNNKGAINFYPFNDINNDQSPNSNKMNSQSN